MQQSNATADKLFDLSSLKDELIKIDEKRRKFQIECFRDFVHILVLGG